MSNIARWSYKNTASVRTLTGMDQLTGETTYSEPYTIACNWIAESSQARSDDGAEFVSRHIIYTEDARPQYLDQILLEGATIWEEIRAKTSWDMKMFNDTMDFKLTT